MIRPFGIRLDGCVYATSREDLSEEEFSNALLNLLKKEDGISLVCCTRLTKRGILYQMLSRMPR